MTDSDDWAQGDWWDEFAHNVRTDLIHKMSSSAVAISVQSGSVDVKLAVELGYMILLDKPIILVTLPGAEISEKMRRVADAIIDEDVDTAAGRSALFEAIHRLAEKEPPDA